MADANSLEEIATSTYWDARYASRASSEQSYEWFKSWVHLKALFGKYLPVPAPRVEDNSGQQEDKEKDGGQDKDKDKDTKSVGPRILHLGCGNSVRDFPRCFTPLFCLGGNDSGIVCV